MNVVLDINTAAVAAHANRLEMLSKSALPIVVRQVITKAAFDTKTKTMPSTSQQFIHRKPTFFMANSKVVPAQGFDINSMSSTVGFLPKSNDTSHSVEDLEQQEEGGDIKNRAFIALPGARVNNSWAGNVKAKNRLAKIRPNIVDSANNAAAGGQGFIRSAIYAGKGGFILDATHARLMEIQSIKRIGRNTVVKTVLVDSVKKGREAHVKATNFMRNASLMSAAKMEQDFIVLAQKRIDRL